MVQALLNPSATFCIAMTKSGKLKIWDLKTYQLLKEVNNAGVGSLFGINPVRNNFCFLPTRTKKEHFSIKNENNTVTFIRENRDYCKAMPRRIDIHFSLEELGIDKHRPFSVSNQFIVNEHVAMN